MTTQGHRLHKFTKNHHHSTHHHIKLLEHTHANTCWTATRPVQETPCSERSYSDVYGPAAGPNNTTRHIRTPFLALGAVVPLAGRPCRFKRPRTRRIGLPEHTKNADDATRRPRAAMRCWSARPLCQGHCASWLCATGASQGGAAWPYVSAHAQQAAK